MAAAALLACSKEQVIEQNRANDEIGFSVVAENQTKAEDVYASNHKMEAFTVAATYTNTKTGSTSWYFQNDNIQYEENSGWVNTTATRYWSADGTHDFYAIVNGSMTLGSPTDEPTVTVDFTPATTVEAQKDLLYAVAADQEKLDGTVTLNFRHALSQIQFKAKNTNSKLYVKISGVQVGNTPGVGTFTYPTTANGARWTYNTPTNYTVTFPAVGVAGNSTNPESVALTCTNEKSMLLIPATTVAWIPTTGGGNNGEGTEGNIPEQGGQIPDIGDDNDGGTEGPGGGGDWGDPDEGGEDGANSGNDDGGGFTRSGNVADVIEGSYLAVKCEIYNVAGENGYASTDVCIYNGWAMIPAAFTWEQGKKYIYTFVFGEGDFGYNGGNGDNPAPTPDREKVLTTMNYTVTVDNFTPVAETEKNMTR